MIAIKRKLNIVLLAISIISISYLIFFVFKGNGYKKVLKIDSLKSGVSMNINKAYIIQGKDNDKEWDLYTDSADVYSAGENKALLKKVRMNIYADQFGKLSISADEGKIDNKDNNLEIYGGVTASSKDYTLTTEYLRWLSVKKELNTEKHVNIKGDRFSLSGKGLIIDTNTNTLKIIKDVNAVFEVD